jgi:hypothetical protein
MLLLLFFDFFSLFNQITYEITKKNSDGNSTIAVSYISNAQIKNSKTENVKILGNCGKTKIEKAGNSKHGNCRLG